jgi:Ca2+/H+ antiporter
MNREEARAALDDMTDATRKLALWRHAAFGAIIGAIVLSQGFAMPLGTVLFVFAMAGLAAITVDERRRYGVFVSGYRKGRTLPLTLLFVALMLATIAAEFHARTTGMSLAVKLGIAAGAFVLGFGFSLIWTRIYRRELLEDAA